MGFCGLNKAQFYNGSQLTFGKNRVQFNERFWSYYDFKDYNVYFYQGGKSLAIFTAKYAEDEISKIEEKIDFKLNSEIQFIVFNLF